MIRFSLGRPRIIRKLKTLLMTLVILILPVVNSGLIRRVTFAPLRLKLRFSSFRKLLLIPSVFFRVKLRLKPRLFVLTLIVGRKMFLVSDRLSPSKLSWKPLLKLFVLKLSQLRSVNVVIRLSNSLRLTRPFLLLLFVNRFRFVLRVKLLVLLKMAVFALRVPVNRLIFGVLSVTTFAKLLRLKSLNSRRSIRQILR